VDELFEAGVLNHKGYVELESCGDQGKLDDLEIVDSMSGDIFDGLTTSPSNESAGECRQTREDVDDVSITKKREDVDYSSLLKKDDDYDGLREEFLTDEESTSQASSGSNVSTLMSNDLESSIVTKPNEDTPITCPDDSGMKEFLALTAYYGGQAGENIDEMNRFLFAELEVNGFAEEVEDLRQEVIRNGLDTLSQVEWAELFKSLYDAGDGANVPQEQPTLASAAAEDRQEKENITALVTRSAVVESSFTGCLVPDMNELALEEGMEMPYPLCQLSTISLASLPGEEPLVPIKKRNTFLSKLLSGPKRGTSKIASAPAATSKKTTVTRVKLSDGSMASVSVDTVSRLQKCEWV